MNKAVAALAAFIALGVATARAQQPSCAPLDVVLASVGKQLPITNQVRLDPVQTAAVLSWYNAQPPESNDTYDYIVLLRHATGQIGLLLGTGDKICSALLVPAEVAPELFRAIAGHGA